MSTIINLSQNIALILALTFIYGFAEPRLQTLTLRVKEVVRGILFGGFAVISMTMPIQVAPGLFYDARTIVICVAGIYGGAIPALIATAMVIVYRVSVGGMGTTGAILSALVAAGIGTGLHEYYVIRRKMTPPALVLLAIGAALAVIGLMFAALLTNLGVGIVQTSFPTTIILYPIGVLLLGTLVTQQQRRQEIERALRASEQRFHTIFDSAFGFTVLLHPNGSVIEVNQAAVELGASSASHLIGIPLWETRLGADLPERKAQISDAIQRAAGGETVHGEFPIVNAQEQEVALDFSLKPLRGANGEIVLLIAEARDITARKQLEQQKLDLALERERSRLLKKFISDVSHDLRTPLAVIRLNLELLRRTLETPQQQQRVDVLASQEQHLTRLLTDMMTMLTLEEQSSFSFKPINLNEVVQTVIDTQHGAIQGKQQSMTFNHPPNAFMIMGDEVELERGLGKLLINAVTYTPKGGSITISAFQDGDSAVIELRDTGIGITPEDLPNIFQRFFRADHARALDTGGTGLGLSIAKRVIEAHGGSIAVESTVNSGSSFRVSLPVGKVSRETEATPNT